MSEDPWFTDAKSNKSTETEVKFQFPPVTLPEGATPAVIGPILGNEPAYLHKAEGTRSFNTDHLLALKFPHHTAEQFATLVWQSDDWNERIVQLTIDAGEVAAADLDMTYNVSIMDLCFGAPRGSEGFGDGFEMVDGADLSDVETVKMFAAHNIGITSDHLNSLPKPHRLVRLELDTADVLPAELSRFSNLEVLQLGGIDGTDDVSYLANMPNIYSLGIRHSDFGEFDDPKSPGLERLRMLDIAYNRNVSRSLGWLKEARSMIYLDVSGTAVDMAALWSLGERPGLRHLRAQCCPSLGDQLGVLSRMPNLTELNVAGNSRITDVGLERIVSATPKLRHLDVRATQVSRQGLWNLLPRLRDLRVLGVSGELLDAEIGEHLKATTQINSLIVFPTDFGDWVEAADYFGAVQTTGNPE